MIEWEANYLRNSTNDSIRIRANSGKSDVDGAMTDRSISCGEHMEGILPGSLGRKHPPGWPWLRWFNKVW